jgi:hypothetical protein
MKNFFLSIMVAFELLSSTVGLSMNQEPNMSIKIPNNTLYLNRGTFKGNVVKAIQEIQTYCNINNVEIQSRGHGYATLIINEKNHSITPYGIDILMMLEFCNFESIDFNADQ